MLDSSYEEFVDVIEEGRDMTEAEVKEYADGRIMNGRQAVEANLADDFGFEEDTAEINWLDFVDSAVDADEINIAQNVTADLSTLDTTTPGEYEVELTVTDFAGNETSEVVVITVEAPEE